jgi:FkbM family methyltransferase
MRQHLKWFIAVLFLQCWQIWTYQRGPPCKSERHVPVAKGDTALPVAMSAASVADTVVVAISAASPHGNASATHLARGGSSDAEIQYALSAENLGSIHDKDNSYLSYLSLVCPPANGMAVYVLDVGGNKGYSLPRYGFVWGNFDVAVVKHQIKQLQDKTHMWHQGRDLQVHVFEPTQSAVDVLTALQESLPFYKFHLHHVGVSDFVGESTFYTPYLNVGDEGAAMGKQPGLPTVIQETVPIVTLDSFYEKLTSGQGTIPKIEFIKIDVEGFEPLVIRGMSEFILRNHLVKAFEFEYSKAWADGRTSPKYFLKDIVGLIDGLAYNCFLKVGYSGITRLVRISGDGFWDDRYGTEIADNTNIFCLDALLPCYDEIERVSKLSLHTKG